MADQLDQLKITLAVGPYTGQLESGRVVINPCVAAIDATTLAIARVPGQISMTELPATDPIKTEGHPKTLGCIQSCQATMGDDLMAQRASEAALVIPGLFARLWEIKIGQF